MSDQAGAAAMRPVGAGGELRLTSKPRAAGLGIPVAVAISALVAGTGLVGAGVAWAPSRDRAQAVSRGAQLYAAECAGCHGARLEARAMRTQMDGARGSPLAPSLGMTGHAWRHSDAELASIVAGGVEDAATPGSAASMPAFAERLGRSEIDAILAYVKSAWPANVRAYQAALDPVGGALTALLRDPAWVFPGQCLSPPADGH